MKTGPGFRTVRVRKVRIFRMMVLLAFTSASTFAQTAATPAAPVEIPKVSVVASKQGGLKQSIRLPGNLIPDEQVQLYSKISGYLEEITVDRGDKVVAGQVIVRLSAPEMEPEIALAEAKVRAAQSRIGKARASAQLESTSHTRLAALQQAEPGAVTQEDVEESAAKDKMAEAEVVTAEAELGVAAADVKRLKTMKDYLNLRAPFEGTITQRYVDPGSFIPAGAGAKPVVEITRVARLRLTFDLPERLAPFVKTGARVQYSFAALPGQSFDGFIARRNDLLASDTRTMHCEVDVANADSGLAPGMYASVQIPLTDMPGTSVVPPTALRTIDGKVCVLVVKEGTVQKMAVEVLSDAGQEVVVSGRLPNQARVITQGPPSLTEGQKVEVQEGN